jgi:DNA modification methylase
MRSRSGTVRHIQAEHVFEGHPVYDPHAGSRPSAR